MDVLQNRKRFAWVVHCRARLLGESDILAVVEEVAAEIRIALVCVGGCSTLACLFPRDNDLSVAILRLPVLG